MATSYKEDYALPLYFPQLRFGYVCTQCEFLRRIRREEIQPGYQADHCPGSWRIRRCTVGSTTSRPVRSKGSGGIASERDLIRERTAGGGEAAKKRGFRFGRPRKLALDQNELTSLKDGSRMRPWLLPRRSSRSTASLKIGNYNCR